MSITKRNNPDFSFFFMKKHLHVRQILFVFSLIAFFTACSQGTLIAQTQTIEATNPSNSPTSTSFPILPSPSMTEIKLPFNDTNVESEYCQSPRVHLPVSDAVGLSDDEIARKLMELWLAYFNAPKAPDYCRIDGYRIDRVYFDERTSSLPLEPKGDFMRAVQFSIKLIQKPSSWMSWGGEIDQQNWLHTGSNVAVFRSKDGYSMEFASP